MRQSEKIGEFTKAMVAAQMSFKIAEKDGQNPHFQSNYATIESVIDSVVPALNAQGIAVIQRPAADDAYQGACLETMLIHASGEWMSSLIRIPSGKNDAHGFGSAYTYARRYSLAAMCGIKQHDDDGNAAAEQAKAEKEQAKVDDKVSKLSKNLATAFGWLKKAKYADMHKNTYRANVVKIIDANEGDEVRILAYLEEQGWKGTEMASDMATEKMPDGK